MAFGNASTNSYVFVGGLPSWYGGDVAGLENVVLPTVLLEPRFRGAIRNLAYKDARANDNTALNNIYSMSRRNPLPLQDLTAYKVRIHFSECQCQPNCSCLLPKMTNAQLNKNILPSSRTLLSESWLI